MLPITATVGWCGRRDVGLVDFTIDYLNNLKFS